MRISDWSSDVCSSDLAGPGVEGDQVDLRGQLVLLDEPNQLARIGVAVVLVLQHHIFEGDAPRIVGGGIAAYKSCELIRLIRKAGMRSEEHTSELQSLMRISYAVFCLKKKNTTNKTCT